MGLYSLVQKKKHAVVSLSLSSFYVAFAGAESSLYRPTDFILFQLNSMKISGTKRFAFGCIQP